VGLLSDAEAGVVPLTVLAAVEREGDRRAEETLHLVAQPADRAPAAASRQKAELRHETAERVAQVEGRALGADGLGGDPGEQESRVAAVGKAQERMGRDGEDQMAVAPEEGVGGRPGMRECRLDEDASHEAQGAGLPGLLRLDGQGLRGKPPRARAAARSPGEGCSYRRSI
jgi:hypothetical protein